MRKMKESELTQVCANFAGKYVEQKFKDGSLVARNLALNCLAHGYYMGVRHNEKTFSSLVFKWFPIATNDKWIETHAIKAANYYITKQGYRKLEWAEQAFVRATVSTGFREGFKRGE